MTGVRLGCLLILSFTWAETRQWSAQSLLAECVKTMVPYKTWQGAWLAKVPSQPSVMWSLSSLSIFQSRLTRVVIWQPAVAPGRIHKVFPHVYTCVYTHQYMCVQNYNAWHKYKHTYVCLFSSLNHEGEHAWFIDATLQGCLRKYILLSSSEWWGKLS